MNSSMNLIVINAIRRSLLDWFDRYVEHEENPTRKGFLEYALIEEEIESEQSSMDLTETQDSLIRDIKKV